MALLLRAHRAGRTPHEGVALFLLLEHSRPDLAAGIAGSLFDPREDRTRCDSFLAAVSDRW